MNNTPVPYQGNNNPVVATPSTESIKAASQGTHGRKLSEASSLVGNTRPGGLSGTNWDRIYPRIPFWQRNEYYRTIGRVQNVVESYVLDIQNREYFYDAGKNENSQDLDEYIKLMENWEEQVVANKLLATMVRNWLIFGDNIISPIDWQFVQLQSLNAKRRDEFGITKEYIQIINGQEVGMDATEYLEVPYIDLDREPWGVGMFDSLMSEDYVDIDGRAPHSTCKLYRQALQDNMKIHHKFASPRVIYSIPNANEETIDNDIVPIIEGMVPGDRAVFNEEIIITQETVDGNARFIEHVNKIIDEMDTGLQSSANRIIAEPSAMADAKEAGRNDDDRTLGIMEKLTIFMNKEVIPRVTGLEAGILVFKWGAKDQFDLEFPDAMKTAIETGVLNKYQAQVILEEQYHWKIPTMEDVKEKGIEIDEPIGDTPEPNASPAIDKNPGVEDDIESNESLDLKKKEHNEKLVLLSNLQEKIDKI